MSPSVPQQRASLRREKLAERQLLSPEEKERLGALLTRNVLEFPLFRAARSIGLFADVRGETPTGGIFRAARAGGKTVCFPRVDSGTKTLRFFPVDDLAELTPGSYRIPEPNGRSGEKKPAVLDVLFVPGVVFDFNGNRLGYGQGYYDRMLAPIKERRNKVGLAFESQIVPRIPIPCGSQDVRMDWMITETRSWEA